MLISLMPNVYRKRRETRNQFKFVINWDGHRYLAKAQSHAYIYYIFMYKV